MLLSPLDSLYKVWEEADLDSKSIKIKTKHIILNYIDLVKMVTSMQIKLKEIKN